jgi:hypothetical protein
VKNHDFTPKNHIFPILGGVLEIFGVFHGGVINQKLMVNLILLPGEIINRWSGILSTSCGTSFTCTGNYYTTDSQM